MTNEVIVLGVKRLASAVASSRQRMTDRIRGRMKRGDGLSGLLVLIPVGSLVFAGLLIIALSRISGVPSVAPDRASFGANVEVQADPLVFEESEGGRTTMRFGLAGARR
jgi:hypothetical protein